MNADKPITLPDELRVKAEERARSLSMSLDEYVQSLVVEDVGSQTDPWRQPLPWEVEKQYLLDEIAFYEEEKTNPQKPAYSVEELMNLLDEKSQKL